MDQPEFVQKGRLLKLKVWTVCRSFVMFLMLIWNILLVPKLYFFIRQEFFSTLGIDKFIRNVAERT